MQIVTNCEFIPNFALCLFVSTLKIENRFRTALLLHSSFYMCYDSFYSAFWIYGVYRAQIKTFFWHVTTVCRYLLAILALISRIFIAIHLGAQFVCSVFYIAFIVCFKWMNYLKPNFQVLHILVLYLKKTFSIDTYSRILVSFSTKFGDWQMDIPFWIKKTNENNVDFIEIIPIYFSRLHQHMQ